ncbi:MAG: methyl-accepting chemotaxis protein [Pseudomonadota bacterium]
MLVRPRMSVARRIWAGFSVTLLMLIVAAAMAIFRFNGAAERFTTYLEVQSEVSEVTALEVAFLNSTFYFRRFLASGDVTEAEKAHAQLDTMEVGLSDYQSRVAPNSAAFQDAAQTLAVLSDYQQLLTSEIETVSVLQSSLSAFEFSLAELVSSSQTLTEIVGQGQSFIVVHKAQEVAMLVGTLEDASTQAIANPTPQSMLDLDRTLRRVSAGLDAIVSLPPGEMSSLTVATLRDVQTNLITVSETAAALEAAVETAEARDVTAFQSAGDMVATHLHGIIEQQRANLAQLGIEGKQTALTTRDQVFMLSGLTVIVGILAAWLVGRSVIGPLQQLTHAISSLAADDEDVTLPEARHDEFGKIGAGVGTIRKASREASSFKHAMQASGTMIMVADEHHRIHFTSAALADHFSENEAEIRKSLPNFRAADVVGSSFDDFHKNVHHQRAMMDALKDRHMAKIALGSCRFDLMISPVFSNSGRRVGCVVQWIDVTAQLSIQQDIDGVIRQAISGDFTGRVTARFEGTVLNRMADNVNTLIDTFEGGVNALQRAIGGMADGDLAVRMEGDYKGTFASLQKDLNSTITRIEELVADIQVTTQEINANSGTISEDANALSQRTESQAASLEETAATMEQMSSTIRNNAENAQTATDLAASTEEKADQGGTIVGDAVGAMARIEESSEKMSQIISVIDSIAFQTNLLALNAAVEAARAGDAGKGFAVVASEVRTLAQRSSEAAKDIKELIQFSSSHVGEGVQLVRQTGDALSEIITSISQVNAAINDITAMSKEQATGVDEISSALSEMDGMTQKNASMAEQSASRASRLAEKATALSDLVQFFRISGQLASHRDQKTSQSALNEAAPAARQRTETVPEFDGALALDDSWKEF